MTESSWVDRTVVMDVVQRVAPQFFAEGHERVYVTTCCGRLLVTTKEVLKCRTCDGKPRGLWVTKDEVGA